MLSESRAPRLFIHAGPHKTGTSAIQHILRGHDDSVVYYPKRGLWADGAHHGLVFNLYQDFARPEVERLDLETVWTDIAAGARACVKSTLVSSELLYDRDPRPFFDAMLAALEIRPE